MIVTEGKTKQIIDGPDPGTVILRSKDFLTGGDAARVAGIPSIGILKTTQTVNVFQLLASAGVPTSFVRQLDERSVVCWDCDMLPVEFVVRRLPWGSYLLRHPLPAGGTSWPRFDPLLVERFHKHAMVAPPASTVAYLLSEGEARKRFLREGVWAPGVYTDPLIEVRADSWVLHPPKAPVDPARQTLDIAAPISAGEDQTIVETLLLPAFRRLEDAWAGIETSDGPITLVDVKFEIGRRRSDGAWLISDVLDNDSWRIWPGGDPTKQLDKQTFRDGRPLTDVQNVYVLVTELTSRLH